MNNDTAKVSSQRPDKAKSTTNLKKHRQNHRRLRSSKPILGRPRGIVVDISATRNNQSARRTNWPLRDPPASVYFNSATKLLGRPTSSPGATATNKTTRATTRHRATASNYPELHALSMPRILSDHEMSAGTYMPPE